MQYIGTKIINAEPMNHAAYNNFRGWALPENESDNDEGYLVEYLDGGKSNVPTHAGYVSWSPKEQFDAAYRPTNGISFGLAIEALKRGCKVARSGWDGEGMWLILVAGTPDCQLREGTPYAKALEPKTSCEILPHIDMWTINQSGRQAMLPGWLASQSDMLSDDWFMIP